jgi:hypothetical protein
VDSAGSRTFHIGGATTSTSLNYSVASFLPHPNWSSSAILNGSDIGCSSSPATA